MFVLGLTGSIGSGKSEAAKTFRSLGCPVFDGDAESHRLVTDDASAILNVAALAPLAVINGVVNRAVLAEHVFANPEALIRLEADLHPKIQASAMRFLDQNRARGASLAVLEIPLLYEGGFEAVCGAVAVVTVSEEAQTQRVMARPDMTAARLSAIRSRQLDLGEKTTRADYILDSMTGKKDMITQVQKIVISLTAHSE